MKSTFGMPGEIRYRLIPEIGSIACPLLDMHSTPQSTALVMEVGEPVEPDDLDRLWDFCVQEVRLFRQERGFVPVRGVCAQGPDDLRPLVCPVGCLAAPESAAERRASL